MSILSTTCSHDDLRLLGQFLVASPCPGCRISQFEMILDTQNDHRRLQTSQRQKTFRDPDSTTLVWFHPRGLAVEKLLEFRQILVGQK